jgi:hypothetical protein
MIDDLVTRIKNAFSSPRKKIVKLEKRAKKYSDLKKEINQKGKLPLKKKFKYGFYTALMGSVIFSSALASNWLVKPQTPFIGKYSHWLDKGICFTIYDKREFISDYFNGRINIPDCPEELKIFNNSSKIVSSEFDLKELTNKNNSKYVVKHYGKWIPLDNLSEKLENALVISEDQYSKRFEKRKFFNIRNGAWRDQHAGVDLISILQALVEGRGGSTLDAQIASNYIDKNRPGITAYHNKFEENILAYIIHDRFSNEDRKLNYANNVSFPKKNLGFVASSRNLMGIEIENANYRDLFTLFSWIPNHDRYFALYRALDMGFENLSSGTGGKKGDKEHVTEMINHINSRLKTAKDLELITLTEYYDWIIDTTNNNTINRSLNSLPLKLDSVDRNPGAEPRSQYGVLKELTRAELALTYDNGFEETIQGLDLLDKKGGVVIKLSTDLQLSEFIKKTNYEFIKGDEFQSILRNRNDCAKKSTFHSNCWMDDVKGYEERNLPLPYERDFDSYMEFLTDNVNVGTIVIKYDKGADTNKIIAYVPSLELFHKSKYPSLSNFSQIPLDIESKTRKEVIGFEVHTNIGSFFKPLWFYHMMLDGIRPETLLQDVRFLREDKYGKKFRAPSNSGGIASNEWFTVEYHLAKSKNAMFADYYIGNNTLQNRVKNQFDEIQFQYDEDDIRWHPYAIGGSWTYTLEAASLLMAFLEEEGVYKLPSFIDEIVIDGQGVKFEITDTGRYLKGTDKETNRAKYETKTVRKVPKPFLVDKHARELTFEAMKKTGEYGTVSKIKNACIDCEGNVAGKTHTENTRKNAGVGIIYSSYSDFSDAYYIDSKIRTEVQGFAMNVGFSTDAPIRLAGYVCQYLFDRDFNNDLEVKINEKKENDIEYKTNLLYQTRTKDIMQYLRRGKIDIDLGIENGKGKKRSIEKVIIRDHIKHVDTYMTFLDAVFINEFYKTDKKPEDIRGLKDMIIGTVKYNLLN